MPSLPVSLPIDGGPPYGDNACLTSIVARFHAGRSSVPQIHLAVATFVYLLDYVRLSVEKSVAFEVSYRLFSSLF